ncbi:TonB-dependent receptor [Erythrobacter arachoides]|uniref:TonB-dependent receptor n=1 Tax=Aurantiacibacter arachoides TaxID=1850444 RepID=A0A844ZX41_9SPHN|nr:TonB-dependent receptor [Aurantiacibacter arachoides]MXO92861.1 TonB-dependent receptor [Aurantiacibacter arachoides]GGD53899.1 Oar protein [Aurantiacibacter arachoides]
MKLRYLLAASLGTVATASMLPAVAVAQQITTGIEGTVTDEVGNPVSNATVIVTDTRTGASRTFTTGASGNFAATGLTTGGPYTVTAEADGLEGQTIENVTTTLQGNTSLTFSLSSGGGVIVVSAARVQLTQLAVGPGISFGAETLENAPTFNRDVRDIIRLDPRVSLDRDDGGSGQDRISCLGGNDRGNAFTVDGISQGDVYGLNDTGFSSRSSTPVPYDALRETQVQFAPFDVEYGNFTGCAINVVTKSGTNDFRFGGFFEYSDNSLRGDSVAGQPVAPIQAENRYGVYLGGPIWRDRLFFFGAYEHQDAGQSQDDGPVGAGFANEQVGITVDQFNEISDVLSSVYGIETGDLVTSRPFENDRYFGRLDFQITDDHRLEATYQRLEEASTRPDDLFTGTSPQAVGRNTFLLSGTESDYYSARLYSQWNDNLSTEFRYSRSEVQDVQNPIGGGEAQSDNPIPRIIVGIDNATGIDGTVLAGPGNSRSANDLRSEIDQYRFLTTVNVGDHTFKAGAEVNHADLFNLFVQNATGTLVFRNIADLREGLLSPGLGNNQTDTRPNNVISGQTEGAFGNFSATGDVTDAAAEFTRTIYSIFGQDEWQVTDNLSAVLGLRVDWYDGGRPSRNPLFAARYGFGNTASFSTLDPLVMPRLALTYDVEDFSVFSRMSVRGGVGVFSGGDPLVWFGNAFQNDGRGFAQGTTQDAACGTARIDVVTNGTFTGVPACFQQSASAQAAAGRGDTQSISPNIEQPSVLRANVGLQTGLDFAPSGFFSGWNLTLDYIYSKYRNPFTIVDLAQTVDPRLGVNGFTIDGRPIYRSIDSTVAGCTASLVDLNPAPVYQNVNAACFNTSRDDELQLTNAGSYDGHVASIILANSFDGGIFTSDGGIDFNIGYAYTDTQDRRNMYNSTAGSNYDLSAAFDRQNPDASRSFFSSKHNISAYIAFREEFFDDLASRFSMSFVARSGRPYSLTFSGGGVFNDSVSGNDNALAYIPSGPNDPNVSPLSNAGAVADLASFAAGLNCAKDYLGRSVERNTCSNDWYYDMDLSISQEIPGPGRLFGRDDRLRLYATMDNFLNFLSEDWNVQRRRNFSGLQDIASVSGVDSQGRYIITGFNGAEQFEDDNTINVTSSVWRLKVGISYDF